MTIDLGDGLKDVLNVYEYDDPEQVAREFCARHNLTDEAIPVLTENIIYSKNQALKEKYNNNAKDTA